MTRTAYTLFTGGGGADIGLRAAGYTLTGGVEYDARIAEVYARNMGHALTVADICTVDPLLLPVNAPDWLHASPVCKNFSSAKTDGEETEGDRAMARATVRFLDAWTPPVFSMEQVWGYRESESFGIITAALTRLGYSFEYWHLNAADYGVPQTRRRLILLARRGLYHIQRPNPTHREGGDMFTPPWIGWYEAIEDLIPTLPESKFAQWQLDRLLADVDKTGESKTVLIGGGNRSQAFLEFALEYRKSVPGVFEQGEPSAAISATASSDMRAFIVDGQNTTGDGALIARDQGEPTMTVFASAYKGMPKALLVYANDMRSMPTRAGDEPAFTITAASYATSHTPSTKPRAWLEHGRVVRMTLRALCRFQSFPDWYEPQSTVEIGNAVPPLLMQRIAEAFS